MTISLKRILYSVHWFFYLLIFPFSLMFFFGLFLFYIYDMTPSDRPSYYGLKSSEVNFVSCYNINNNQTLKNSDAIPGDFVVNRKLYRVKTRDSFEHKSILYLNNKFFCIDKFSSISFIVGPLFILSPNLLIWFFYFIFFGKVFIFPWHFRDSPEMTKNGILPDPKKMPATYTPRSSVSESVRQSSGRNELHEEPSTGRENASSVSTGPMDNGYTIRRIKSVSPATVGDSLPAKPSSPGIEQYPNAELSIKYRPEIKSILQQNQALISFDVLRIHQLLESNPQISAHELSEFVEKIKTGNEGPFENPQYNKIYSELYDLGSEYQEKFMRIHDSLGDTFDPKLVLNEFEEDLLSKNNKKQRDEKDKENFISDLVIIKSLPENVYESTDDFITLYESLITVRHKKDNYLFNYYSSEELARSIGYKIYANLKFNRYLINYEKYNGFLIMRIGDGKVYVTNVSTRNIRRASKQYQTITHAKKAVDAGEVK